MSAAHFRIRPVRLHLASRDSAGTVTIDRDAGTFAVRPLHSRRLFVLPLNQVASGVVRSILAGEAIEARRQKDARRKERRRAS